MALYPKILTLSSQNRFSQEVGALAGTPGLHGPAGLTPGHPLLGPTQAPSSGPACFRGPGGHFVKGRELEGRCLRPSSLRVPGTPQALGARQPPRLPAPLLAPSPGRPCCQSGKETFVILCLFPPPLSGGPMEIYSWPGRRGIRSREGTGGPDRP